MFYYIRGDLPVHGRPNPIWCNGKTLRTKKCTHAAHRSIHDYYQITCAVLSLFVSASLSLCQRVAGVDKRARARTLTVNRKLAEK